MRIKTKYRSGLSLPEVMTLIIIVVLIGMVIYPMYEEYVDKKYMAEATANLSRMEKHFQAYFTDHTKFITLDPNPAFVPGINAFGKSAPMMSNPDWEAVGYPVTVGSEVTFSYQAFAGQTASDSPTPVVDTEHHLPTDNMNLERIGAATSNSGTHTESLRTNLESSIFSWLFNGLGLNAFANDEEAPNACASFGVSRPIDFGIQEGVVGYNWVVLTAVGNFRNGNTCSLVAKTIQNIHGEAITTGFVTLNYGE